MYCPINTVRDERGYYLKELRRVSTNIKKCYRRMADDDRKKPGFVETRRWRRISQCRASDVLKNINTLGCYIRPMPGHDREDADEWINCLLHRTNGGR